ncbi:glutathionyl-hydroquinone reductase [Sarracenia purpurea var. burkii]
MITFGFSFRLKKRLQKFRTKPEKMYCTSLLMSSSLPIPGKTTKITTKTTSKSRHASPRMSLNQQTPNSNPNLLTTITSLLWGPSLPPHLLISAVRTTWSAAWHLMMSQLAPSDPTGRYTRPTSQFRLTSNSPQFSRQKPGTLHLYVGLPCPWAHRTLIVRALKGLETAVPVSIASPGMDGSWEFRDGAVPDGDSVVPGLDNANGRKTLREVYKLRKGGYNGRSTVPMLWDVERKEVVCNESYDIIEFFNSGLNGLANNPDLDLSPPRLREKIDEWNQIIYPNVNNGVYRCGFAQSQEAYDSAVNELFSALDKLDDHLRNFRYLCGDVLTLADVCLFTTLVRFDLVYNVIFKCTKRKLIEFPNLHPYMRDIYQIPKVAATCNFGAIMDGYYKTLFPLNPSSIRPAMPSGCEHEFLSQPHNRSSLSSVDKIVEVHIS